MKFEELSRVQKRVIEEALHFYVEREEEIAWAATSAAIRKGHEELAGEGRTLLTKIRELR